MSFLRRHFVLGLILLAGLIVRLYILYFSRDFIWDELFSFVYSQKSWGSSIHYWLLETNPPFHLLLLKLWWYLVPPGELTARILSIGIGVGALAAMWHAARSISPYRAWIATLLLALTPQIVFHATVARGYALLVLLTCLSLAVYLPLLTSPTLPRRPLIYLAVINSLLLFTHLTGITLILTETAFMVSQGAPKRNLWCAAHSMLVAPVGWILASFIAKRSTAALFSSAWFLNLSGISAQEKWGPFILFLFGPSSIIRSVLFALIFIVALVALLIRTYCHHTLPVPIAFLVAQVTITVCAVVFTQTWNIKFLIIAIPAFTLLVAYLLETFVQQRLVILLAIAIITLPGIAKLSAILPLSDWSPINEYLTRQYRPAAKQIFIDTSFIDTLSLDRYYHAPMPWLVYQTKDVQKNPADAYVTMNYLLYHHSEAEINQWYQTTSVGQYAQIYLLNNPLYNIDLESVLIKNGWHKVAAVPNMNPARDQRASITVYAKP